VVLDDLVFLNRTVAQRSTKYGAVYCSVAWSDTLRALVRLYPLVAPIPPDKRPHRWRVYRAALSRPAQDTRSESWHVDGDLVPTGARRDPAGMLGNLEKYQAASIAALNDARRSLGLLVVSGLRITERALDPDIALDSHQEELFGRSPTEPRPIGSPLFRQMVGRQPVLEFADAGGWHQLQLLSIGAFALLARGYDVGALRDAYRVTGTTHAILVGNQAYARNSWVAIEVFPLRAAAAAPQLRLWA
jgi:hypothetical protein